MPISRTTHTREELVRHLEDFPRPASFDPRPCMPPQPKCPKPDEVYRDEDGTCCVRRWVFPKSAFPTEGDVRFVLAEEDVSLAGSCGGPGRHFADPIEVEEKADEFVVEQRSGLDV